MTCPKCPMCNGDSELYSINETVLWWICYFCGHVFWTWKEKEDD